VVSHTTTTFTVNGRVVSAPPELEWTLLRYLREALGLTGTKQACDNEGSCGACTVIINGQARRACLEPLTGLAGCRVETVESLRGAPHPLLQTVIQDGIFQCGYCAPGALMAAKALLDRTLTPSEEEVIRALSPVVCRCSALCRMHRSVLRTAAILRGEAETGWTNEDARTEQAALAKLTGALQYTDDLLFTGLLYGQALRSPLPHARLLKLETTRAQAMPGVVRVLTAQDLPGENRFGLLVKDQPVLCAVGESVRYTGDALALVIAATPEQATAALAAVEVELEPLPVITSPKEALAPQAPILHSYLSIPNILSHQPVRKGDPATGFAQATVVIEAEYRTPFVEHAFMELECSVGVPEPEGSVTVYCGSQGPAVDRPQVAATLGLPVEQVRIAHVYIGGAFGGKEDIAGQILAALGAQATGRPVKVRFSRAESLRVHPKRHAQTLRYKMGATQEGRLTAADITIHGDTGAYASMGQAVLFRSAVLACGPYVIPHAQVDAYAVHTNNPPCGAFRGFGGAQTAFAAEVHLQKLCNALGMDPFEFRLKNALEHGRATLTGQIITAEVGGATIKQCLEAVKKALDATPPPSLKPHEKLGVGLACAYKNVGYGGGRPDRAESVISLEPGGYFLVRYGAADSGQGANDVMATIAARTLGVPLRLVHVRAGDTDAGMTTASRATFVSGNAVLAASQKLRRRLWEAVAEEWDVTPAEIEIQEEAFVNRRTMQRYLTLAELAAGDELFAATADYIPPETNRVPPAIPAEGGVASHRLHYAYNFGAQVAMVAVNEKTGQVRPLKIIAAHDMGTPISRRNCVGQIEGAIVQGLGYALSEQFPVVGGYPQTQKFSQLGLLRLKHLPAIEPILIETPHPQGPYGAKGLGELALSPTAPAIVNAIHDAVGVWIHELPATRERVLAALHEYHL
jgi:CO/xanthine dehydrogenase Mo-binding subunit/aerobic-type carbon monoxide dehydrogenase small subunit (CoxS/CutS family)